uniref:Uncharacterized protein n=1 Tax=Faxonius propinquus nudivirus TaxID=3139431 RepID=A0AAU8GED2_9VIRU
MEDIEQYRFLALRSFIEKDPIALAYIRNLKEKDVDNGLLQNFYKIFSSLQNKISLIKIGKGIIRQSLILGKNLIINKIPFIKFLTPEKIKISVNEEEYLALINHTTTVQKDTNAYFIIGKNMIMDLLNLNIEMLLDNVKDINKLNTLNNEDLLKLNKMSSPKSEVINSINPENSTDKYIYPNLTTITTDAEIHSTDDSNFIVTETNKNTNTSDEVFFDVNEIDKTSQETFSECNENKNSELANENDENLDCMENEIGNFQDLVSENNNDINQIENINEYINEYMNEPEFETMENNVLDIKSNNDVEKQDTIDNEIKKERKTKRKFDSLLNENDAEINNLLKINDVEINNPQKIQKIINDDISDVSIAELLKMVNNNKKEEMTINTYANNDGSTFLFE